MVPRLVFLPLYLRADRSVSHIEMTPTHVFFFFGGSSQGCVKTWPMYNNAARGFTFISGRIFPGILQLQVVRGGRSWSAGPEYI